MAAIGVGTHQNFPRPPLARQRTVSETMNEEIEIAALAVQHGVLTETALFAFVKRWKTQPVTSLTAAMLDGGILSEAELEDLKLFYEQRHQGSNLSTATPEDFANFSLLAQKLESILNDGFELSATITRHDAVPQENANDLYDTAPPTLDAMAENVAVNELRRFRIVKEHAKGGLGVVYLAVDDELERDVAVKQIRPDRADSADYRVKFLREAKLTGQLEHPGIVPVYSIGQDQAGVPYYAMRFIRGKDLLAEIQRFHTQIETGKIAFDGPELRALLRRFIDVCNAIEYAHNCDVLHRDLKPSNIMLGDYGETLVVDWGLAKKVKGFEESSQLNTAASARSFTSTDRLKDADTETRYGSFLGSPAYAPPEQVLGQLDRLGPWSDIYSLGAMLYQLLTNKVPVTGDTIEQLILCVTEGNIQFATKVNAQVPTRLASICSKAMSLEPPERFQSTADLREEIERWLDDRPTSLYAEPVTTRFARWTRHHPALSSAAMACMLITVLSALAFIQITNEHRKELRESNLQLTEKSEQLEATNAKLLTSNKNLDLSKERIENQARNFQLNVARRDLDLSKQAFATGQHSVAATSARSALELSAIDPSLQGRVKQATWSNITNYGRSTLHYLGPDIQSDSLQFSIDGKVSWSPTIGDQKLWDLRLNRPQNSYQGRPTKDQKLAFSPNGEKVSVLSDGKIKILDLRNQSSVVGNEVLHASSSTQMKLSNSGTTLATKSEDFRPITIIVPGTDNQIETAIPADTLNVFKLQEKGNWKHTRFLPVRAAKSKYGLDLFISDFDFREQANCLLVKLSGTTPGIIIQIWSLDNPDSPFASFLRRGEQFMDADVLANLSDDGQRLALAAGRQLDLVDTVSGKIIDSLHHNSAVISACFAPNSTLLVTATGGPLFYIWNGLSGELVKSHRMQNGVVDTCFSPDGLHLALGFNNGTVQLLKELLGEAWPSGATLQHGKELSAVKFTPDGTQLVTFDGSLCFRIWDLPRISERLGQFNDFMEGMAAPPMHPIDGIPNRVKTMEDEPLEPILHVQDRISSIPLEDGSNAADSEAFESAEPKFSVQFHPTSDVLYTDSAIGGRNLWRSDNSGTWENMNFDEARMLRFSDDGTLFALIDESGNVKVGDFSESLLSTTVPEQSSPALDICFSSNSQFLAMALLDGSVFVHDMTDKRSAVIRLQHEAPVAAVRFNHSCDMLAIATESGLLNVYTGPNFEKGGSWQINSGAIGLLEFSHDNEYLLSQAPQGSSEVIHLKTEENRFAVDLKNPLSNTRVHLNPQENQIAYFDSMAHTINLVELETQEIQTIAFGSTSQFAQDFPSGIEYSFDGTFLVAACADGTLALIDTKTFEVVEKLFSTLPGPDRLARHPKKNIFCLFGNGNYDIRRIQRSPLPTEKMLLDGLSLLEQSLEMFPDRTRGEELYTRHCAAANENADWTNEIAKVRLQEIYSFHLEKAQEYLDLQEFRAAKFHLDQLKLLSHQLNAEISKSIDDLEAEVSVQFDVARIRDDLVSKMAIGDQDAIQEVSQLFRQKLETDETVSIEADESTLFELWLIRADAEDRGQAVRVLEWPGDNDIRHDFPDTRSRLLAIAKILNKSADESDLAALVQYMDSVYVSLYWLSQSDTEKARAFAESARDEKAEILRTVIGDEPYMRLSRRHYEELSEILARLLLKLDSNN